MIPYTTDAPIYHWPKGTVAIIAINVVLHLIVPDSMRYTGVVQGLEETSSIPLLLQYGTLKPWQWLTSIYLHSGFMHLIGNMVFLWAFGLVVEGKVGLLPFLGIYHVIGVGQSALEQVIMFFAQSGGSLGASSAIFGLLGVTVMWAPRNDFECLWRFGTLEIPILMYAALQFFMEGISLVFSGFSISSGALHLMGAACGLAIGGVWIKKQWVDCEGYDLFSVMAGKEGAQDDREDVAREATELLTETHRKKVESEKPKLPTPPRPAAYPLPHQPTYPLSPPPDVDTLFDNAPLPAEPLDFDSILPDAVDLGVQESTDDDPESLIVALRLALAEKQFEAVADYIHRIRQFDPDFELSQAELYAWIEHCLATKQYAAAVPLLYQHIRRFDQKRVPLQVQLAKILLHLKQPDKASAVLQKINLNQLSPTGRAMVESLLKKVSGTVLGE